MLTAEQYENNMLNHVRYWTITEFFGKAQYVTTKYCSLTNCAKVYRKIRKAEPNRRVLVYAVCQPPSRQLTVSIPIAEDRLP